MCGKFAFVVGPARLKSSEWSVSALMRMRFNVQDVDGTTVWNGWLSHCASPLCMQPLSERIERDGSRSPSSSPVNRGKPRVPYRCTSSAGEGREIVEG